MHTTTVRFDSETWAQLKDTCSRAGIPAAQYVREATIARLAVGAHVAEVIALRRDLEQLRAQLAVRRRPR